MAHEIHDIFVREIIQPEMQILSLTAWEFNGKPEAPFTFFSQEFHQFILESTYDPLGQNAITIFERIEEKRTRLGWDDGKPTTELSKDWTCLRVSLSQPPLRFRLKSHQERCNRLSDDIQPLRNRSPVTVPPLYTFLPSKASL